MKNNSILHKTYNKEKELRELREFIENAHMAGQAFAGIEPSYSEARSYYDSSKSTLKSKGKEFTGDYHRCNDCGHIFDYWDLCPECGKDKIDELNAKEVMWWSECSIQKEQDRLDKMLSYHGD